MVHRNALFAVAAAGALVNSALAFAACSSSSSSAGGTSDAGEDGRKEAGPPIGDDSGAADAGETHDQCFTRCEMLHPAGLALDKKIDECWTARCPAPCIDGDGGFDASGAEGGGGDGGAAPSCKNAVDTGDKTCDQCTQDFCCAPWDACFDDPECSALDDCRSKCPP